MGDRCRPGKHTRALHRQRPRVMCVQLRLRRAVGVEQRQLAEHRDVGAVIGVALGEHGHLADDDTAGLVDASVWSSTSVCTPCVVMDLTCTWNTLLM